MAAGEPELLLLLLITGDDDGLETTVLVARDVTDDCDGRVAKCGEEAGVVAAVEGGDVDGGDFSTDFDLRPVGPPLMATFVGKVVVALSLPTTVSGLDSGAVPVLRRMRRRSVDDGRFSVDSSCGERFRLDFRLADLSRSISVLRLVLLFTGLNPARSLPSSGFLAPAFIVEVRIRGEAVAIDGGESQLRCCRCLS